jgi:HK97 family phage major capsid protein
MELKRAKLQVDETEVGRATDEVAFRDLLHLGRKAMSETRALSLSSDGAGGFLCPLSFRETLTASMRQYDQLFDACDTWVSGNGSAVVIPILDDGLQASAVIAENALSNQNQDINFDSVAMAKVASHRTGLIRVSLELATDSFFDINGVIARVAGRRFARGVGAALTTTAVNGANVATVTASPSAVTSDELLDLSSKLNASYIGAASWAMNSSTLVSLRKLKAATGGQYLVPFEYDADGNARLWGKRVLIAPSLASIGALSIPVLFGDFNQLLLREVANSLKLREYRERFVEFLQVGYEVYWRIDSCLLQPNNASPPNTPIVALQCHS